MTYSEYLMYGEEEVKQESSSNFLGLVEKAPEASDPVDDLPFDMDLDDIEGDLEDKLSYLLSEDPEEELPFCDDPEDPEDEKSVHMKVFDHEDLLPSELREYWKSLFYLNQKAAVEELDKFLLIDPKNYKTYAAFCDDLDGYCWYVIGMIQAYSFIESFNDASYLKDQLIRIKKEILNLYPMKEN